MFALTLTVKEAPCKGDQTFVIFTSYCWIERDFCHEYVTTDIFISLIIVPYSSRTRTFFTFSFSPVSAEDGIIFHGKSGAYSPHFSAVSPRMSQKYIVSLPTQVRLNTDPSSFFS